ncbi:MAG: hypothetical protein L0196_02185 [candidate division Zixibacteria bacterium]|nr:hypothetical protein [candidate division Zixibacteria bacterium]
MGRTKKLCILGLVGMSSAFVSSGSARMLKDVNTQASSLPPAYKITAGCLPDKDNCVHKVGRLWFTVTNYGFFGNQGSPLGLLDCLTGERSSSAEFPGGSRVEYLFQGALWIGAVVGGDTLLSLGTDGWLFDSDRGELHADCEGVGDIIKRSKNPASPYYDPNAVSDMDFTAVMYDTLTDPAFVHTPDPNDGRPFKPLGLKIVQKSYSWSAGWGQDWVMLDYSIVNIGRRPLTSVYLGVFADPDVGHENAVNPAQDDLSGFKAWVPNETNPRCNDTINLAHVYDQDGDPSVGTYRNTSASAVTGIRVVRAPLPLSQIKTSFNWWTPNGNVTLDWGPQKAPGRKNLSGGLGQPEGDAMKYAQLSNEELDFPQVYSALNQSTVDYGFGNGWLPPLVGGGTDRSLDIANGFDTRYTVSFGPFSLSPLADDPSDTLRVTLGYIAGQGFHKDPDNYNALARAPEYFRDPVRLETYLNKLDFGPVATNARWVQRVFDNETIVETVFCGVTPPAAPDSVERRFGDGIPDFKGPLPPPVPQMQFETRLGEVLVRWFGKNTENVTDEFSDQKDFEGYRVWLSGDGTNFTNVGSFDKVDWKVWFLNTAKVAPGAPANTPGVWEPTSMPPLTWDEIQRLYAVKRVWFDNNGGRHVSGWDTCSNYIDPIGDTVIIGRPIDPNKFYAATGISFNSLPCPDLTYCNPCTDKTAIRVRFCNTCNNGNPLDTIFYFVPQDFNLGLSQARLYPSVTDPANDSAYWYQYKISGLFPSEPTYVAICPFDFGFLNASGRLDPLEVTPSSAKQAVFALPDEPTRAGEGHKISVFPNPYRIDNDYSHYENPQGITVGFEQELHRKLNFINLPARCVIRIYTLDGDLVEEIRHDKDPLASDAGYESWNLLSRNAQAITAGLYLYTVQSELGVWTEEGLKNTYVGKIVIIK